MNKLYLIDGMSVVFRAYHAMLRSGLKTPKGEPSFAVFAFANILTSLLEKEKPEHIAVVFDTAAPTFRHEMYPLYKANRDAFPEELVPQLARIKELIDCLSIQRIELPGYEADDIIGTLSKNASDEKVEVVCLTSDKDYYQLVNEHVKLYKPSKQSNEDFEIVGIEGVNDKFGVLPRQVIDVLALIGDASDNVPGVKGIGDKTAIPLIQKFGSIEQLYERIGEVERELIRNKLIDDKEKAFLAKTLVTIKLDVPLDIYYHELDWKQPNFKALDAFFAEMGFNTLRKKWNNKAVETGLRESFPLAATEAEPDTGSVLLPINTENKVLELADIAHDYKLIDTKEKLAELKNYLQNAAILSVDLETSGLDKTECRITGIALCAEEGKAFYIPVFQSQEAKTEKSNNTQFDENSLFFTPPVETEAVIVTEKVGYLDTDFVLNELRPLLENEKIKKCGQNIKFDAYILKRYGINLYPIIFDSMLASYILNPDNQHGMDALAVKWMNYRPIPITVLIGEKKGKQLNMEDIAPADICDYAAEDADVTLKLKNILEKELEKEKLLTLANDVEFPLIDVLIEMEYNGVAIDTKSLSGISSMIDVEQSRLIKEIYQEAGSEFNIDSPKQLGYILFEKMGIPTGHKTKTGFSTNVQVLSLLADDYPIAEKILDYRQLTKLKSTYVEVLPKLINPKTGRIHTTFNQTGTSTGRLSSTDPNLQNIPIRTDLGKEIRRAFIAQNNDRLILSADYSQIELRIMAHISGDKNLINAFKGGQDIHAATAAILFDIPITEVNSDMRRVAKTVNFGIMYGLGSFGLSQRLQMDRREAQAVISNYFVKYPGIKSYIDNTIKTTREKGYAETISGRRRYFANIDSKNHNLRTADERAAINMPIQGTASDMIKIAMIKIHSEMKKRRMKSMMTIQVHDEIVFEAYKNELDELKELVKSSMESALPLGEVPVVAEIGTGENWFLAH